MTKRSAVGHFCGELEPGKSGALTLDFKLGLYAIYCNVPGHFGNGMWTLLKVEK